MNTVKRTLAAAELLLVLPAALFMTALFVRNLQPAPLQPAESARRLVDWYSARPFLGLDVLLIALPLAAFVLGSVAGVRIWRRDGELRKATMDTLAAVRAHLAMALVGGATVAAGGILAIVALHVMTD